MKNKSFFQPLTDAVDGLIPTLEDAFLNKAPALPEGFKTFLVAIIPFLLILTVIGGIFALFSFFGSLGTLTLISRSRMFIEGVQPAMPKIIAMSVVLVFDMFLALKAYKPASAKRKEGWKYLYYLQMLSLVYYLISFKLVSLLLVAIIGFYLLFQIKEYYT